MSTTTLDLDAIAERFLTAEFPNASFFESQRDVPALVAEVRRLRTDNTRLDNATRGALDDLAKVRADLADTRAALRAHLHCDECEELATRTHAETASFGCDAHGIGEGWSDTTHAAAVRAAMEGGR